MKAAMPYNLVVTHAFGDYAKGDQITDAAAIKKVEDDGLAAHVVKVAKPEPDTKAKPDA